MGHPSLRQLSGRERQSDRSEGGKRTPQNGALELTRRSVFPTRFELSITLSFLLLLIFFLLLLAGQTEERVIVVRWLKERRRR